MGAKQLVVVAGAVGNKGAKASVAAAIALATMGATSSAVDPPPLTNTGEAFRCVQVGHEAKIARLADDGYLEDEDFKKLVDAANTKVVDQIDAEINSGMARMHGRRRCSPPPTMCDQGAKEM